MKYQKPLSSAVRRRLPRYYRYLSTLLELGISKISSKDLGNRMGITSSQVRQDFSSFGGYGLQGYGYDVKTLHQEIGNILGLNTIRNMIIIGAGSLGQALAKHKEFEKKGFKVIGIFDVKTELIGQKITEHEIRHLDTLPQFLENNQVDIAILTIPENFGREVAAYITELGIKAIWNFVPIELKTPDDVIVENIHLIDSLMVLGYNYKHNRHE